MRRAFLRGTGPCHSQRMRAAEHRRQCGSSWPPMRSFSSSHLTLRMRHVRQPEESVLVSALGVARYSYQFWTAFCRASACSSRPVVYPSPSRYVDDYRAPSFTEILVWGKMALSGDVGVKSPTSTELNQNPESRGLRSDWLRRLYKGFPNLA